MHDSQAIDLNQLALANAQLSAPTTGGPRHTQQRAHAVLQPRLHHSTERQDLYN